MEARSVDRLLVAWFLGCAVAGPLGCQHSGDAGAQVSMPEKGGAAAQSAPLIALADEYWSQRMEANPLEATELGDRRFDDRLRDLSPEARAAEREHFARLWARVNAVAEADLVLSDRITRALLLGELDADMARSACQLDDWVVDADNGPQVRYLRLPALQSIATAAQGRALGARLQKIGPAIDQESANLRQGLADGRVTTRAEAQRVLAQLDELLGKGDDDWPLHALATATHPDWTAGERLALIEAVDGAIAHGIRPALVRYRDLLRGEILPHARDDAHPGIANVPGGAACYARLVKVHTSLELSAEEIHRIGLEELAQVQREIQRLGAETMGTDDLLEMRRRMVEDKTADLTTRGEVEQTARAALARATAAEERFLARVPQAQCVVRPMNAFEEKDGSLGYYWAPAVDGSRPATYYVNTSKPEARPRDEVELWVFHQSVPGRHLQAAIAQGLIGLPEFRRHLGVTAFVEGWASYAEDLADELGLYLSPLQRPGMLSFSAARAALLVIDTGIHALGWSREKAIAFMEKNTLLAHDEVVDAVDRSIAAPAQALAAKLGEREILHLREEAEHRLGTRFELRAFNSAVLGWGAVSLPLLRDHIQAWISLGGPSPP
jgi:uncharacterized protein (DUF885 family)